MGLYQLNKGKISNQIKQSSDFNRVSSLSFYVFSPAQCIFFEEICLWASLHVNLLDEIWEISLNPNLGGFKKARPVIITEGVAGSYRDITQIFDVYAQLFVKKMDAFFQKRE